MIASLQVALGCLTVLPLGPRGQVSEQATGRSFLWFPLVGALIGGALVFVYHVSASLWPPSAAGAFTLLAWVALTGALHLDGVADVCDGLYAGRTPADRLRIMKDPHVGAMGVIGVTMLLLMKCALLGTLPHHVIAHTLWLAPCFGRYVMALLGTTLPYARSEGGTAAAFVRSARPGGLVIATGMTVALAWAAPGGVGLGLFAASLLLGGGLRLVFQRMLGGVTGDALGASGELVELAMLFAVSLMAHTP